MSFPKQTEKIGTINNGGNNKKRSYQLIVYHFFPFATYCRCLFFSWQLSFNARTYMCSKFIHDNICNIFRCSFLFHLMMSFYIFLCLVFYFSACHCCVLLFIRIKYVFDLTAFCLEGFQYVLYMTTRCLNDKNLSR